MKKIIFTFILLILITKNVYAGSGDADEYKITIKKVELCETGSSLANCLNPITIFEGDSGTIDIANTSAGEQAAALGDASNAIIGKTYSHVQTTMDREITIKGYVSSGNDSCSTIASNGSDADVNGKGDHSNSGTVDTPVAGIYYAAEADNSDIDANDQYNGITAAGVVGGDDANDIDAEDFQWRNILAQTITITLGKLPTIELAFGTDNTIAFAGNIATAAHCTNTANATTGLFVTNPDVTITISY